MEIAVQVEELELGPFPVLLDDSRDALETFDGLHEPTIVLVLQEIVFDDMLVNQHFQGEADIVDLRDILIAVAEDDGPLAGNGLDKPVRLKFLDGLTNRGTADVEFFGQLDLTDEGAGRIFLPQQKLFSEKVPNFVRNRVRRHEIRCHSISCLSCP